jgi:hypothetical protein
MNVAVIGIGRIGLPLAATIASRGHWVFGCDVNAALVERVNRGENPIPDEAGLDAMLKQVLAAGTFKATTETAAAVAESQVILFAVSAWMSMARAAPTSSTSTPPPKQPPGASKPAPSASLTRRSPWAPRAGSSRHALRAVACVSARTSMSRSVRSGS